VEFDVLARGKTDLRVTVMVWDSCGAFPYPLVGLSLSHVCPPPHKKGSGPCEQQQHIEAHLLFISKEMPEDQLC